MKKLKILSLILVVMLVGAGLTGCFGGDDKKEGISKPVNLIVPKGVGEVGLADVGSDIKVKTKKNSKKVGEALLAGGWDFAILDAVEAAKQYKETGGNLKILSPITYGNISIIKNGFVEKIQIERTLDEKTNTMVEKEVKVETPMSANSGKMHYLLGSEGDYTEVVTNTLYRANGASAIGGEKVEYQKTKGDFYDSVDIYDRIGVAPSYIANKAMSKNSSIAKMFDVDQMWEEKWNTPMPELVLVVNANFAVKRGDEVSAVMATIADAYAESNEKGHPRRVIYNESNRGINILKRFYEIIDDYQSDAIGGHVPPKAFYFEKHD